ncbi:unnamed protein product [Staurois parvus]|uniref:Uncharacterized protein n=1 Tax=Staurois parvus TaxID=386267 RepID=A0ABN9CRB2_9NEOB|nr:unnamed protein product [Staurois parvus]
MCPDDLCSPTVPPVSVHQCQLSVLINATCQCPSVPHFSTYQCTSMPHISAHQYTSLPHISAHLSCLLVSPINASQCRLSVPYMSAAFQCHLPVPIPVPYLQPH